MPRPISQKSKHYVWVIFVYLKEHKTEIKLRTSRHVYIEAITKSSTWLDYIWIFYVFLRVKKRQLKVKILQYGILHNFAQLYTIYRDGACTHTHNLKNVKMLVCDVENHLMPTKHTILGYLTCTHISLWLWCIIIHHVVSRCVSKRVF